MRTISTAAFIALALIASACSQSPTSPSAALGTSGGSLRSTADDTPVTIAGIAEPNDAPSGFTFVLQGEPHADYSQSTFVAWRPFAGVGKYETSFERYDVDNVWRPVPSLFTNAPTKFQAVLLPGRWRARTRSVFATHQGAWTGYIVLSIQSPPRGSDVPVDDCAWEEEAPGFFTLRAQS